MIEKIDLLTSAVGLVITFVLVLSAAGIIFGATGIEVCQWSERLGVVLAVLGGALHNVALLRRFGSFHLWFSFKELYGSCPHSLRSFALGIGFLGALSFVVLMANRDTAMSRLNLIYNALTLASFFAVWFSLMFGQAASLIYGVNQSSHPDLRKSRAGR